MKFPVIVIKVIPITFLSLSAVAQSEFTPKIDLKAEYLDSKAGSVSETGSVITISPGVLYTFKRKNLDISIDYQLSAVIFEGLSREDTTQQNLSLTTLFTHAPDKWDSQIFGSISQTNISGANGTATLLDIPTGNTQEVSAYGVSTNYRSNLGRSVAYNLNAGIDNTGSDQGESSSGQNVRLNLDNQISDNKLFWNLGLGHQVNSDANDDETIQNLQLGLNYRYKPNMVFFIESQRNKTDSNQLTLNSNSLGMDWRPTRSSKIRISAGTNDNNETYSIDSSIKNSKTTFSVNYGESITSQRNNIVQQITDNFQGSSSLSTDITSVIQKNAQMSLTQSGKKSSLGVSAFYQETYQDNETEILQERKNGITVTFTRNLTSRDSMNVQIRTENIKNLQSTDVVAIEGQYAKVLGRRADLSFGLATEEQETSVSSVQNQQTILTIDLQIKF